jgi:hypothetical protein
MLLLVIAEFPLVAALEGTAVVAAVMAVDGPEFVAGSPAGLLVFVEDMIIH